MRSASGRRWRPAPPLRWFGLVLLCAASCPGSGDAVAPMAVDDSYATSQGLAISIPAPGLLANDLGSDLRCDPQTTTSTEGSKVV